MLLVLPLAPAAQIDCQLDWWGWVACEVAHHMQGMYGRGTGPISYRQQAGHTCMCMLQH